MTILIEKEYFLKPVWGIPDRCSQGSGRWVWAQTDFQIPARHIWHWGKGHLPVHPGNERAAYSRPAQPTKTLISIRFPTTLVFSVSIRLAISNSSLSLHFHKFLKELPSLPQSNKLLPTPNYLKSHTKSPAQQLWIFCSLFQKFDPPNESI